MMKKILLAAVLALLLVSSCFALVWEDLNITITITCTNVSGSNYTYSISYSPDLPSDVFLRWQRIQIKSPEGDNINSQPSTNITYTSGQFSSYPYLGIRIAKKGSYPNPEDRPRVILYVDSSDLPQTKGATYVFSPDIGDEAEVIVPDEVVATKGNIWFESVRDVFELETGFATPARNAVINSDTYCIGKVVSSGSSDRIRLTVETSGRLESRSDPSSYLDFHIALCPRYSTTSTTDANYYYTINPAAINTGTVELATTPVPNTDNLQNYLEFILPKTDKTSSTVAESTNAAISAFTGYLMICFDTPDTETLKRLAVNNDYYATIDITWDCAEASCGFGSAHSHIQHLVVRGYLGEEYATENNDWVNFTINSDSNAGNIRIMGLYDHGTSASIPVTIANINVTTGSRTTNENSAFPWNSHVYVFLSSSGIYNDSTAQTFKLEGGIGSLSIPFTITVTDDSNGSNTKVFDGTTYWGQNLDPSTYCLNLGAMTTTSDGTKTYGAINYNGTITLSLTADGISTLENNVDLRPGRYRETVFYHLVYAE